MSSPNNAAGEATFNREALENMLTRRFFVAPSFEIYGGTAGLFDFGPPGTALLANFVDQWRKHFVLEEDMLEVDSTILTPYEILKTSGHVDRFCDWMCKDTVTGDIFRADHLVENVLSARLEADTKARTAGTENGAPAKKDDKKPAAAPAKKTKQKVELAATKLDDAGFLRPETAQGQFVNFAKLLDYNNNRMPFASASIGKSFRNEISPRNGLLRVREFLMAEIEHYVDPADKSHPGYESHKNVVLNLLPATTQLSGSTAITHMKMGDAVEQGIIDNQTLGYFLARVHLFLTKIGIRPDLLRFRQHMSNEMAHYACDCWDAELKSSYGWVECVGCADRSAYDLTRHSERTGRKLVVRQPLPEPRIVEKWTVVVNKKAFGPAFKKAAKPLETQIVDLPESDVLAIKAALEKDGKAPIVCTADGNSYDLTPAVVTVEKITVKEHVREYVPNVIEPSFGIGRILHSLFEHSFYTRPEDVNRGVLRLLVPLSNNAAFAPLIAELRKELRKRGLPARVDDSAGSIGKRYARNDELGTPFAITVDFQSVEDRSVTLRERDSTAQVRASLDEVLKAVEALANEEMSWEEVTKKYPSVKVAEDK
ncbi:hypothetical protein BCR44DRAFT_1436998 [Catenaria anguillulae PL171]|uniref:glycine--tRNA ligase n=1 Tax=Catenaria anguillulae PL171 TaxID=765915 RepID=A0A1Y2HHI2_9FUNG|nr:hypothetical protein BCR44DRAFT_1436998 [Catenaria anguillulae PL171]